MDKFSLEVIKKEFADFDKIYIYGAGIIGQRVARLLNECDIKIAGFITTEGRGDLTAGFPVYKAKDMRGCVQEKNYVIPAFLNADREEIADILNASQENISDIDPAQWADWDLRLSIGRLRSSIHEKKIKSVEECNPQIWKEVLVIRLDKMGDVICSVPFIRELKRNLPDAKLSVIVRQSNKALLSGLSFIDDIFLYDDNDLAEERFLKKIHDLENINKRTQIYVESQFKGRKFDCVFLLNEVMTDAESIDEVLLMHHSGALCRFGRMIDNTPVNKIIWGIMHKEFTLCNLFTEPMHEVQFLLETLRFCGMTIENELLQLSCEDEDFNKVRFMLKEKGCKMTDRLIAVGVVTRSAKRNWPLEYYKELFDMFAACRDIQFLLLSNERIEGIYDEKNLNHVIDLTGQLTLGEVVACIKQCALYIGSNTGLMHIAAAFGIPAVTIYAELQDGSPLDVDSPCRFGAFGTQSINLLPPGGLDGCHGVCRKDYSHCIRQIKPKQIFDAMENFINIKG